VIHSLSLLCKKPLIQNGHASVSKDSRIFFQYAESYANRKSLCGNYAHKYALEFS